VLLRGGATVIATTRFPVDSALRFGREPDFMDWGHRLKFMVLVCDIFLRKFSVILLSKYERLDILINNAAQTVRRPAGFYI
jgi:hypothetical protein